MAYTEQRFMADVHRKGALQRFTYRKTDAAAGGKSATVTLHRIVTFTGRTGVPWHRIAANADRTVEDRRWGTRRDVYFVDHTPAKGPNAGIPQVYVTILPRAGSFRTRYFVDGLEMDRAAYNSHRTPGAVRGDAEPLAYMDLNLASLDWMS